MRIRRVVSTCLVVTLSSLSLGLVTAAPANAGLTVNCVNADQLSSPLNLLDRCAVSTVDSGTHFVAEMTGAEGYCDPYRRTYHSQRVRVVGSYKPGGSFLLQSIDIRYLSGTHPWAFYNVHVIDGNNYHFERSWNNYGNLITTDGASDTYENTVHIVTNYGFAPVFGARGYVEVRDYPHFFKYGYASGQICTGDYVVARFTKP